MTEKWYETADVVKWFAESANLRRYEVQLKTLYNSTVFYDVLRYALGNDGSSAQFEIVSVPRKPGARRAVYEATARKVVDMLAADVGVQVVAFDHKLQPARVFRRKVQEIIRDEHADMARRQVAGRYEDQVFFSSASERAGAPMSKLYVHNYNVRDLRGCDEGNYYIVFQHQQGG